MINTQKPESVDRGDGTALSVHSVFSTLQGEGPFTGKPATFIRLAGCNLQCPLCDTDYTSSRWTSSAPALLDVVREQRQTGLIVITGGEPLRQNIVPLVTLLCDRGYTVQIETNGTLPFPDELRPFLGDDLFVVVSPKMGRVHESIRAVACAWKYVAASYDIVDDGLPRNALGLGISARLARPLEGSTVYLQPCDEKDAVRNDANVKACVRSCLKHGHTLQLQLHKILGME